MSALTYTFSGVSFQRIVPEEWQPWFASRVEYTRDLILDSTEDYLDIGATTTEPLQIRAVTTNESDRDDLIDLLGATATLSNTAGRSATATLVAANPLALGLRGYYAADLTFVRRP